MTDQELIPKILARDRHALSAFYHRYTPRLRAYIRSKVTPVEDAEEILQDTLFGFLEAIRDFEGHASVRTFLFSICNHKIIDFYRRKKIGHLVFSRTPNLEALVSPILNPEDELDMNLMKEKIHRVLSYLLPNYRRLLTLKYIDDLSVSEIARQLAVSVKSAESQLFRARKAFVERFLSI
jgi:RNA polymerase sigma factor (sigma-70 family)